MGTLSSQTMAAAPGQTAGSSGTMIMIDRIEVSITPETLKQYPNAADYGREAADSLSVSLRAKLRAAGGGTVS
jgi:hypothetical protein